MENEQYLSEVPDSDEAALFSAEWLDLASSKSYLSWLFCSWLSSDLESSLSLPEVPFDFVEFALSDFESLSDRLFWSESDPESSDPSCNVLQFK